MSGGSYLFWVAVLPYALALAGWGLVGVRFCEDESRRLRQSESAQEFAQAVRWDRRSVGCFGAFLTGFIGMVFVLSGLLFVFLDGLIFG